MGDALWDSRAKWETGSFEYETLGDASSSGIRTPPLISRLQDLAARVLEGLRPEGVARVDFRVDSGGTLGSSRSMRIRAFPRMRDCRRGSRSRAFLFPDDRKDCRGVHVVGGTRKSPSEVGPCRIG